MVRHIAYTVVPVQLAFITPGLELTLVACRRGVAEDGGICHTDEHIVSILPESFDCTAQAAVEKAEVESDVIVVDTLPSTVGGDEFAVGVDGAYELSADKVAAGRTHIIEKRAVVPVDTALVTNVTVGGAELKLVEPAAGTLHKGFFSDTPTERRTPEECPAVFGPEFGAAVITGLGFNHIFTFEVIVGTAIVRHNGFFPLADTVESDFACTVGHIERGLDVECVHTHALVLLQVVLQTGHHTHIVHVFERLCIVQIAL